MFHHIDCEQDTMPELQETEPYRIADQYHSQGKTIKVVNVGAGAAGLLLAYKMKKLFNNYELTCYEKYTSMRSPSSVGI